ncbi:hypothetical protein [uncultured Thiodictyon sp.]|uniref:hypothetical protein n=1 Tax=uncultured Thiodictyon sp. TaxID=1846217 RepID=UPI0025E119B9|nr:hypothetical protein [uncultured Thiodictyon sp.]
MQDVVDLDRFNDRLEVYDTCPWGSVQLGTVELSLVWDILGLTDVYIDALDPSCAALPQPTERARCRETRRQREWQGYLNRQLADDPENGRKVLRIAFSTSLQDPAIAWLGLYNTKAWYGTAQRCDPVQANGVAVNFDSSQGGTYWQPRITIEQKGASTLRRAGTAPAEYIPVGEYLNMQGQNADTMFGAKAVLSSNRNGLFIAADPDPGVMWNNGLLGRSVTASNWSLEVKDVGVREALDWSKLADIMITIDVIGSTQ